MMAVDSKLGETKLGMGANGTHGASNGAPVGAVAEGTKRTKRTSSLMRSAAALPKVEHSLDEFIARANQTLVDVSQWGNADKEAKEADDKRREQDALRWKQAEQQMRESEAREQSLRRQLDGLQGKLAEAEARVAVALSSSGSFQAMRSSESAQHEKAVEELRAQIDQAQQRIKASEAKSAQLSKELEVARTTQAHAVPAVAATDVFGADDAEERVKLAEAKAAKALAAARAAAAGLTVSSADLAAIESGLVVPQVAKRGAPWIPIMLAFAGGLAIMFLVWKLALSKDTTPAASTTPPQNAQPTTAPPPAPPPSQPAPAQPTVTPIEDKKPTVTPIEEPSEAPSTAKADDKADDKAAADTVDDKADDKTAPAIEEPKAAPPEPRKVVKKAPVVRRPVSRPAVKKATPKTTRPSIEDPFAEPAKKAPAKKPPAKPAGGIVDPFGG